MLHQKSLCTEYLSTLTHNLVLLPTLQLCTYTLFFFCNLLYIFINLNKKDLHTKHDIENVSVFQEGEEEYKFEWQKGAPREKYLIFIHKKNWHIVQCSSRICILIYS